jgi:hypothetical protein
LKVVLWIRIGSGFNGFLDPDSQSGYGFKQAKMAQKNRKVIKKKFIVGSAGSGSGFNKSGSTTLR